MVRFLSIFVVLLGCGAAPSVEQNPFTAIETARSGYETIDLKGLSRFEAEAAVLVRNRSSKFVINIAVTRADRNDPKIDAVWVPGRAVQYNEIDTRGWYRTRQEVGFVELTAGEFALAADRG
ncbi:MAG: hypothetical protein AAGO57_06390, partial [Pseudomonadota bacterium]